MPPNKYCVMSTVKNASVVKTNSHEITSCNIGRMKT